MCYMYMASEYACSYMYKQQRSCTMHAYIYVLDDIMHWRIVNTDEHMDDVMLHTYTYTDMQVQRICSVFLFYYIQSSLRLAPNNTTIIYKCKIVANLLLFTYMYM